MVEWPTYTYAQADRLLDLRSGTSRRWINGYRRQGKVYDPILREKPLATEWVTWGEFLEAKLVAHYRDVDNVPTLRIRQSVERLRRLSGLAHPLAQWRTYIEAAGRELLLRAQEGLEGPGQEFSFTERARDGQLVLTPWVRNFIDEAEAAPGSTDDAIGATQLDAAFPDILSVAQYRAGLPTVRNRNVLARTVAGLVESGELEEDVAEWYKITTDQVDQARRFVHVHPSAA